MNHSMNPRTLQIEKQWKSMNGLFVALEQTACIISNATSKYMPMPLMKCQSHRWFASTVASSLWPWVGWPDIREKRTRTTQSTSAISARSSSTKKPISRDMFNHMLKSNRASVLLVIWPSNISPTYVVMSSLWQAEEGEKAPQMRHMRSCILEEKHTERP